MKLVTKLMKEIEREWFEAFGAGFLRDGGDGEWWCFEMVMKKGDGFMEVMKNGDDEDENLTVFSHLSLPFLFSLVFSLTSLALLLC